MKTLEKWRDILLQINWKLFVLLAIVCVLLISITIYFLVMKFFGSAWISFFLFILSVIGLIYEGKLIDVLNEAEFYN